MRVSALFWLLLAAGCHHASAPGAPAPAPAAAEPPGRPMSMVTSVVVLEACPGAKHLNTRQANREIEELVGPCTKVPGGAAHFSATLLPGGRVELASPSGDPEGGVVPTCLVQSQGQLKHTLKLASPCKFDVKLEERKN